MSVPVGIRESGASMLTMRRGETKSGSAWRESQRPVARACVW